MDLLVRSVKKRMDRRICSHISPKFAAKMENCTCLSDLAPALEFLPLGILFYWQSASNIK